jgi:uncharacterized protein YcnI
VALIATAALAGPTAAHVEPEVQTVPAGSEATVAFEVEHGCDGSPTVALELQVPDGVADARPVDKAGWTGAVADRVVSYRGGPLPDDQPDTFQVRFTVPDDVGATLRFPMIQTCETGSIDWIQTGAEDSRPAPSVEVGPPDPNAPVPTTGPSTTAAPEATTTTAAETTTTAPDTTTTESADGDASASGRTAPAAADDGGDDDGVATIAWVVGGLLLVAGAITAVAFARRPSGAGGGGSTGAGGGPDRS